MHVPLQFIGNSQGRRNFVSLSGGFGLSGVNQDAAAALMQAGAAKADCKFVPYSSGSGGTNVCDIGDGRGYQYGAELINQPGGAALALRESMNIDAGITAGNDETKRIQSMIATGEYQKFAAENRARLCLLEPWTCPATPSLKVDPNVQSVSPSSSLITFPNVNSQTPVTRNGSGSAAQVQNVRNDPRTVQGSAAPKTEDETKSFFAYNKEGITLGEMHFSWIVVAAGAGVVWYMTKGKGGR